MNFMLTNYFQAINSNSCRQFILNFLRTNPFFATKMYVNNYRHFNRLVIKLIVYLILNFRTLAKIIN